MPPSEVALWVGGAFAAALFAYVSRRIIGAADRIDSVALAIERHETEILNIKTALSRGTQRMDRLDDRMSLMHKP